jgi:hypothetical protein
MDLVVSALGLLGSVWATLRAVRAMRDDGAEQAR